DVRITFSFAASDVLQRQGVHGAPADIFAAADQVAMDKAERAGAIQPSTRRDFATNTLVLIKPADAEGDNHAQGIAQLADLDSQAITRIGLGNPATVPAGRYARDSLREANLWDALQEKQVLAQHVRQVLDYVARGEVDAGFVFATDAALMPDRVKVVENVASPTSIRYPLALVQRKERPDAAADFYDFILSQPGQQILSDHGF